MKGNYNIYLFLNFTLTEPSFKGQLKSTLIKTLEFYKCFVIQSNPNFDNIIYLFNNIKIFFFIFYFKILKKFIKIFNYNISYYIIIIIKIK